MKIGEYDCRGFLSMKPELVQLITSGKKTRTVRLCPPGIDPGGEMPTLVRSSFQQATANLPTIWDSPYKPNDLVFLKEGIYRGNLGETRYECDRCLCRSATGLEIPWHWKRDKVPAMNTGYETTRGILRIKSVGFEHLGAMTSKDAIKEGVQMSPPGRNHCWIGSAIGYPPIKAFVAYWDSLAKSQKETFRAMERQLVRVIWFEVAATARNQFELLKGIDNV